MKAMRWLGLCLAVVLVLVAAVATASASAAENALWTTCEESKEGKGVHWEDSLCTKESATGKFAIQELTEAKQTRLMKIKAKGAQKLDIGGGSGDLITCSKLKSNEAADIIGGAPGKAEGILEYEGCTVEEHAECKVNEGKVTTNPLTSELVYVSEEAAKGKKPEGAALLSKPTSGGPFYKELVLKGACPKAGKFEPKGEALYDFSEGGQHRVEHALTSSSETIYWINEGGVAVAHKVVPLTAGTESVTLILPLVIIVVGVLAIAGVAWYLSS
jgi:hypothetical protein